MAIRALIAETLMQCRTWECPSASVSEANVRRAPRSFEASWRPETPNQWRHCASDFSTQPIQQPLERGRQTPDLQGLLGPDSTLFDSDTPNSKSLGLQADWILPYPLFTGPHQITNHRNSQSPTTCPAAAASCVYRSISRDGSRFDPLSNPTIFEIMTQMTHHVAALITVCRHVCWRSRCAF